MSNKPLAFSLMLPKVKILFREILLFYFKIKATQ